jgi:hypothetical protein
LLTSAGVNAEQPCRRGLASLFVGFGSGLLCGICGFSCSRRTSRRTVPIEPLTFLPASQPCDRVSKRWTVAIWPACKEDCPHLDRTSRRNRPENTVAPHSLPMPAPGEKFWTLPLEDHPALNPPHCHFPSFARRGARFSAGRRSGARDAQTSKVTFCLFRSRTTSTKECFWSMSEAGPGFLSVHERFGRRDAKNWNDLGEICARKTVAVQRATGDTSLSSKYRSSPDSLLDRQPVVSPSQPPLASARSQTEDEEKQDHFLVWITAPIQSPLNLVDLACRGAIWLFAPSLEPAGARQHSSASPSQANPPGTVVAALRAGGAWEIRNARGGDRALLAVCLLTCG